MRLKVGSAVSHVKGKVQELIDMGIDVGEGTVSCQLVKEEDWANNWKKYYKPTKIGENITIKPVWEDYEP